MAGAVHRNDARATSPRFGYDWAAGVIDDIESNHDRIERVARGRAGQHRVPWIALEGFGNSDRSYLSLVLQSEESRKQPIESRRVLRGRDTMQAENVEVVRLGLPKTCIPAFLDDSTRGHE